MDPVFVTLEGSIWTRTGTKCLSSTPWHSITRTARLTYLRRFGWQGMTSSRVQEVTGRNTFPFYLYIDLCVLWPFYYKLRPRTRVNSSGEWCWLRQETLWFLALRKQKQKQIWKLKNQLENHLNPNSGELYRKELVLLWMCRGGSRNSSKGGGVRVLEKAGP